MKYLYQRYNGIISKYERIYDDIYKDEFTGIVTSITKFLLLGELSEDITDLLEVGDILELEKGLLIIEDEDTLFSIQESLEKYNIKSILTKEEFNKRKFEV